MGEQLHPPESIHEFTRAALENTAEQFGIPDNAESKTVTHVTTTISPEGMYDIGESVIVAASNSDADLRTHRYASLSLSGAGAVVSHAETDSGYKDSAARVSTPAGVYRTDSVDGVTRTFIERGGKKIRLSSPEAAKLVTRLAVKQINRAGERARTEEPDKKMVKTIVLGSDRTVHHKRRGKFGLFKKAA